MSLMVEGVVDSGMDGEKTLGGSSRLEPLHLALSSPHDLMGAFLTEGAPEKWAALETPLTVSLRLELLRDDHRPLLQFADLQCFGVEPLIGRIFR
jgi:hypothetical protein